MKDNSDKSEFLLQPETKKQHHERKTKKEEKNLPKAIAQGLISTFINTSGAIIGEVLPPTLNFTQKLVLPEILESLHKIYESHVPNRTQEWIEVLIKILNHFLEIIITTEQGNILFHLFDILFLLRIKHQRSKI